MKKRLFSVLILMSSLAGCASPGYKEYLQAQSDANRQALEAQKPLIRITAQPGQQITGLQSLEVYTPQQMPVIQQARENEWARVLGQGLGVVGQVGSIYYGGKAAASLASEIRQAGTAGYAHIQAPGSVSTTTSTTTSTVTTSTDTANTMSNSTGVLGSGTYQLDSTHAPTVVTQPTPVIVTQPAPVVVQP